LATPAAPWLHYLKKLTIKYKVLPYFLY